MSRQSQDVGVAKLVRSAGFHCTQATDLQPRPSQQGDPDGWTEIARVLEYALCESGDCLRSKWRAWAWTVQVIDNEEGPAARVHTMIGDCPIALLGERGLYEADLRNAEYYLCKGWWWGRTGSFLPTTLQCGNW